MRARRDPQIRADQWACRQLLWRGSKTFAAASLLLPARVREPAEAVYAFCRVADDAADQPGAGAHIVEQLHARLELIYRGRPVAHPADRALTRVVRDHEIPQAVLAALLAGFGWDLAGRRYRDIDALVAYCARVASSVGVIMTLLMERDDPETLSRAVDLGIAMQLTNIARDVGEDARAGRCYLPQEWLAEVDLSVDALLREPRFSAGLGELVRRLLRTADGYYRRAEPGIAGLPADCRLAIAAARLLYREIGREVERQGGDSVSRRAVVATPRKLLLLAEASRATNTASVSPQGPTHPAAAFLIDAALAHEADRTGAGEAG